MPETRYNELLGLPIEVGDPDYYQLMELERGWIDGAEVEERFKLQMSKLQSIHSPKHKEFIEFLKGELKKARAILTDGPRRRQYDADVRNERTIELRKLIAHMLVDGTLSQQGEVSLIEEGKRIGLDIGDVKRVIEEEIGSRGAQRVSAKRTDAGTQAAANSMVRELAHEVEEARIAARFAEAKAKHAEQARDRAEEQALMAMRRAKEAQVLVRQTVTRESLSAAVEEQEREQLEAALAQVQQNLEEKDREIEELREQVRRQAKSSKETQATLVAHGARLERVMFALCLAVAGALAGPALRALVPSTQARLDEAVIWSTQRGVAAAAGALVVAGTAVFVLLLWVSRRGSRTPYLLASAVFAALAFGAGALFLR